MKLYSFNITNFRVDGGAMFGVVPKLIWSRYIQADEDNLIPLALRSLVIEDHDRIILIDTGIGNKQDKKFKKYLYLHNETGLIEGLALAGYHPNDITDVVHTHLHFDHCGGGIEKSKDGELYPTFPNARYWVGKTQWENALNPNIREKDAFLDENFKPLEEFGLLHLIEKDTFIYPGIELRTINGHTPGQLLPIITFGQKKLIFGADLIPTKAHVPIKYNMAYDLDVGTTIWEKEKILKEACSGDTVILFEHDAQFELGAIDQTDKGYHVNRSLSLADWINAH